MVPNAKETTADHERIHLYMQNSGMAGVASNDFEIVEGEDSSLAWKSSISKVNSAVTDLFVG